MDKAHMDPGMDKAGMDPGMDKAVGWIKLG